MGGRLNSLGLYPFANRGLASGDLFSNDLKDGYYTINVAQAEVTNNPCDYGVLYKMTSSYGFSTMEVRDVLYNVKYSTSKNDTSKWASWKQE